MRRRGVYGSLPGADYTILPAFVGGAGCLPYPSGAPWLRGTACSDGLLEAADKVIHEARHGSRGWIFVL